MTITAHNYTFNRAFNSHKQMIDFEFYFPVFQVIDLLTPLKKRLIIKFYLIRKLITLLRLDGNGERGKGSAKIM